MRIEKVGIYCRLSKEDDLKAVVSESIENQKELLIKYASDKGWEIVDIYVDDGYTGTNFERPAFQRLIEDIDAGLVNNVIIKDASRLGRNYIETGQYIDVIFPEKNVRVISVNDGYDSGCDTGVASMMAFKAVINDMYSGDISKKITSSFKTKAAAGKFIGSFPCYGYKKDPKDKNKLIIDTQVSDIVKRIFDQYLSGMGYTQVAHSLNSENVPSPSSYKKTYSSFKSRSNNTLWGAQTIKVILNNPIYAGHMAQGKFQKVNYKSKKLQTINKEDWIVVENTHEPIIPVDQFKQVQQKLSNTATGGFSQRTQKLLSGYIYCADCGQYMTYHKTPQNHEYVICSTYKHHTAKHCSRHAIKADDLNSAILDDIKKQMSLINKSSVAGKVHIPGKENKLSKTELEIKQLEAKIEDFPIQLKNLYLDKLHGVINESDFIVLNKVLGKDRESVMLRLDILHRNLDSQKRTIDKSRLVNDVINSIFDVDELTREIVEKLISRIDIYEDGNIKIKYKFEEL